MRLRVASSLTTTNTHGCLFSALGAEVAASGRRSTRSSGTSSAAYARQARWRWTTSKKSGIDARERVDVEDAQGRVPGPVVKCWRTGPTAEVLGDAVGHAREPV